MRFPSLRPPKQRAAEALNCRSFLRKFSEVSLIASFIGAVIAYHLSLPSEWLAPIYQWQQENLVPSEPGAGLALHLQFLRDLIPFIEGGAPVLELKSTVWLLCGGFVIAGVLIGRIYERALGRPVFAPDPRGPETPPRWMRRLPVIAVVGFIVWSAFSFSPWGWGPRPPVESIIDDGGGGVLFPQWLAAGGIRGWLAGLFAGPLAGREVGGGFHSLVAFLQVSVALVLFLAMEELIRTRRLVYKLLGLFIGLGVVAAAVAVAVQAGVPFISDIWIKWGPQHYRNDMGGFIGHNAAISSFLIAPLLLTATILLAHGRKLSRWVRGALVLALAIMALALLMAQSRAVIPILLVITPVLLFLLARRALVRPPLGFWVAVPLVVGAIIITQVVDHPANPLYRRSLPLAMRVRHVTGDHLLTETRLRITAASLPVVRQNLLTGTGFGSFQYVYPEAQGRYYEANPRSRIAPTGRRTFRAHNEYLQTLFETGLVGLGLVIAGLIAILLSGWRALVASLRQRHIALQLAVLVSISGLLLHCLFDFPLRVAPLAASLAMLLAIWSAGHRLWVIPVKPMEERPAGEEPEEESHEPPPAPLPPTPTGWKRFVPPAVLVGGAAVSISAMVAIGTQAMNWFSASYLDNQGQLALAHHREQGTHILATADRRLEDATRLMPLMGNASFNRSQVQYLMLVHHTREQLERYYAGEIQSPLMPPRATDRAMLLVNQSLADTRFHGVYRHRALLHQFNSQHDAENRESHMREALADMERAVLMNPGDYDAIRLLIDWFQRDPRPRDREIQDLYALIVHFHSYAIEDELLVDFNVYLGMLEYERAYRLIRPLQAAMPDDVAMRARLLEAAFVTGRTEEAAQLVEALQATGNVAGRVIEVSLAAQERNFDRALALLRAAPARDQFTRSSYEILRNMIELEQAAAEGDTETAEQKRRRIIELADGNPILLQDAAVASHTIFGNIPLAIELMNELVSLRGHRAYPYQYATYAHLLSLRNAEELTRIRRAIDQGTTPAFETERAYKEANEAIALYNRALQSALLHTEEQLIRRRMRDLQILVGAAGPPS